MKKAGSGVLLGIGPRTAERVDSQWCREFVYSHLACWQRYLYCEVNKQLFHITAREKYLFRVAISFDGYY